MKKLLIAVSLLAAGTAVCGAQEKTGAKLPAPWGDMLDMSTSSKTIFTVQGEFIPGKYEIEQNELNARRNLYSGGLGFIFDSPVSKQIPIYLDYGLKINYSGNKFENGKNNYTNYHYLRLDVPVSVLFKTGIANTPLAFAGFFGFDANFYPLAQKEIVKNGEKTTVSLLDKSQGYKYFNLGWHIGCRIYCMRYFIGIGFEGPVTKMRKADNCEEGMQGLVLNLGVSF